MGKTPQLQPSYSAASIQTTSSSTAQKHMCFHWQFSRWCSDFPPRSCLHCGNRAWSRRVSNVALGWCISVCNQPFWISRCRWSRSSYLPWWKAVISASLSSVSFLPCNEHRHPPPRIHADQTPLNKKKKVSTKKKNSATIGNFSLAIMNTITSIGLIAIESHYLH